VAERQPRLNTRESKFTYAVLVKKQNKDKQKAGKLRLLRYKEYGIINTYDFLTNRSITMILENGLEQCNCKKKKCERHGRCKECIEHHTNNSKYLPYCKRSKRSISSIVNKFAGKE